MTLACPSDSTRPNRDPASPSTDLWHGRRRGHLLVLEAGLREALDLEQLGGAQEVTELLVRHLYLAVVHEAQQRLEATRGDVLQDHDRVLARVRLQKREGAS